MSQLGYKEIYVSRLGLKSQSKKEVYDLISQEGNIFLPPIRDAHAEYISQVIAGEKKHLKCDRVKVCRVPHLHGLRTEDILEEARKWIRIDDYLPEYEYKKLPNRNFLCNLVNSLAEKEFKAYIGEKIRQRAKKVVLKKGLSVKALPQFIDIFENSQNISVAKGRTHFLIKKAGRRRWEEVSETAEDLLKKEKQKNTKLLEEVKELNANLEEFDGLRDDLLHKKAVIEELKRRNLVDSDGFIFE